METEIKKDPLRDEISFDGIKFWFRDEPLGRICNNHICKSPVPKEVMDEHKQKYIDEIINFGEV